jgi:hypothetical protein
MRSLISNYFLLIFIYIGPLIIYLSLSQIQNKVSLAGLHDKGWIAKPVFTLWSVAHVFAIQFTFTSLKNTRVNFFIPFTLKFFLKMWRCLNFRESSNFGDWNKKLWERVWRFIMHEQVKPKTFLLMFCYTHTLVVSCLQDNSLSTWCWWLLEVV